MIPQVLFEARQMKKKWQSSIEKERKSSARLRLVSFVPLLSIFIKESESRLYLFVSKIDTNLSRNRSIRVDTIPGNNHTSTIRVPGPLDSIEI